MTKPTPKPWYWLGAIIACIIMLGASSSLLIHGYRPTTFHSETVGTLGQPIDFHFAENVDGERFTREAIVKLDSFGEVSQEEVAEAFNAARDKQFPTYSNVGSFYKATFIWNAPPDSPLNSCYVKLADREELMHPSILSTSPEDDPTQFLENDACQPNGRKGPDGYTVIEYESSINQRSEKRPQTWKTSHYFATNRGFTPTNIFIYWLPPSRIRIDLEA